MKTIVFDSAKCIFCHNCQLACKDEHVGNDWSPIAKAQSEGQFWIRVEELERGEIPRVRRDCTVIMCQHCENPVCAQAVPGAVYKREDGLIIVDPEKAAGHPEIVDACPYGVIYWNEELEVAQKCTGCAHLLDGGRTEPRCVHACPAGALRYVGDEELAELGGLAEQYKPEFGTKPRMAYLNLPKPYVSGEVYSPSEDACLENVRLNLVNMVTGEAKAARTNNYGEFKIEGLASGRYALALELDGYYAKTISNLELDSYIDLGEVKLMKKAW